MERSGQSDATGQNAPLVSVVIATHNRPAALRQALRSVLGQTLQDFEILVIGDACRPDTAALIAEFADPRIVYIDLPVNFGEQSGPNNIGFARARGRFVALLNHDDLWFPDHLAATTGWIDATNADVVIARGVAVEPPLVDGKPAKNSIFGIGKDGFYDPASTTGFGSAQIVRRTALDWLGPWRPASQCFCESSQDWLFRAWRKGAIMATMPHLTVLKLHSGNRKGSYVGDTATEQEELFNAMQMPDALRAAVLATAEAPRSSRYTHLRRRFLAACGIHPRAQSFRHRHGRGAFVARLREIRGLPPMPEREPGVQEMLALYSSRADTDSGGE